MNKEEYIKYLKSNSKAYFIVELNSSINTIFNILISKGLCSKEECQILKQQYEKQILEDCYRSENKKDLQAYKKINDLFGNLFKGDSNGNSN